MASATTTGIPLEPDELTLLPAALRDGAALAVLTDRLLERDDPIGRWLALSAKRVLGPEERQERNRLMRSAARHLLGDVDAVVASKGRWYRRGLLVSAQLQVQHPAHLEAARNHLMWGTLETLHLHWTSSRSESGAHFVGTNPTLWSLREISADHPDLLGVLMAYADLPLTRITVDYVPAHLARVLARPSTFPQLRELRLRRVPKDGALLQRAFERVVVDVSPESAGRAWTLLSSAPAESVELRYGRAILTLQRDEGDWRANEPWTWQHDRLAAAIQAG